MIAWSIQVISAISLPYRGGCGCGQRCVCCGAAPACGPLAEGTVTIRDLIEAGGGADRALGEGVGAAVIAAPARQVAISELRKFAADRLVKFKVPREIVVVTELPKGPTGKLQRIGLAAALGLCGRR